MMLLEDIRKEATSFQSIKVTLIIDINYNRFDSIIKNRATEDYTSLLLNEGKITLIFEENIKERIRKSTRIV